MKRHLLIMVFAKIALGVTAVYAEPPPAGEYLPTGFKLVGENNLGGTIIADATKANKDFPKPHMDQGIKLRVTWQANPMPDMILNIAAQQPEEPPGQQPGSATRTEPCGKERHNSGVLTCRRSITPWIGSGDGPELVTLTVSWFGKASDGIVSIEVDNLYGAKATAIGWIDAIIPKSTK